jgi:hypothetical protein
MRQASKRIPDSAEKTVRDIRRATRRRRRQSVYLTALDFLVAEVDEVTGRR